MKTVGYCFLSGVPSTEAAVPKISIPVEILACPHCERLFQTTPRVLGKRIRCRGCGGLFHIPQDTGNVPLSPAGHPGTGNAEDSGPPVAIACVVDGREARRCPSCSRTFSMKPTFVGKVIRCRGCKVSFRVAEAHASPSEPAVTSEPSVNRQERASGAPLAPLTRTVPESAPESEGSSAGPVPTIFDDIGDVLDDVMPSEPAPSVVRPRNIPVRRSSTGDALFNIGSMVFGGLIAVPITQMILWWVLRRDPMGVAAMLPEALRWLAPDKLVR